eukprot:scaffold2042_cov295-Pinguiococcus_pyrenoidosus.AAC.8
MGDKDEDLRGESVKPPMTKTPYVWVVSHPGMRNERTLAKINDVVESAFQRYITRLVDDAEYERYLNEQVAKKLRQDEKKHLDRETRAREEAHKLKEELLPGRQARVD